MGERDGARVFKSTPAAGVLRTMSLAEISPHETTERTDSTAHTAAADGTKKCENMKGVDRACVVTIGFEFLKKDKKLGVAPISKQKQLIKEGFKPCKRCGRRIHSWSASRF